MKLMYADFETRGLESAYTTECPVVLLGVRSKTIKKVIGPHKIKEWLEATVDEYKYVWHNSAFDMSVIKTHYGEDLYNRMRFHDTMLMAYCNDTSLQSFSLDNLAEHYLGRKKVKVADFKAASKQELAQRVIGDLALTKELFELLVDELRDDERAWDHYRRIELPYVRRIIEMQLNGLQVDETKLAHVDQLLNRYQAKLSLRITRTHYALPGKHWKGRQNYVSMLSSGDWFETTFSNIAGERRWEHSELEVWNTNSPQQTAKVLRKLYPKTKWEFRKTKDGKDTVSSEELIELAEQKQLPLLHYLASANKTSHYQSSFTAPIQKYMRDGRIYASMNQCVTRTGRLSSSKPNLQNIPRKGKVGAMFRDLFVAGPGNKILVGDLDRIELVVLAHYLEEYGFSTYMADAVRAGTDLHQVNADAWECDRDPAKKGIFTLIYGAADDKFADTMGLSLERSRQIKAKIQETTGLFDFREMVVRNCRNNGGVLHDILGRKLCVPEVLSNNQTIRASGERKICNYLIQSSAGSIFKVLQNDAEVMLQEAGLTKLVKLNVVVHDESVYEAASEVAELACSVLDSAYNDMGLLSVPITAKFQIGNSWYEAK